MRIAQKISWLLIASGALATALLTSIGYSLARSQYYDGVDRQLTAAAAALPAVIGDGYLGRAIAGSVADDEFDHAVYRLTDLARRSGVFYLYAFAMDDAKVVHLATSASERELATKDWSNRMEYEEPPPELLATFHDGHTRFAEYTDEFGSFRSVFIRHLTPDAKPYVIGVDAELGRIHADLRGLVWRYLAAGLGVAAIAGALGLMLARRIAQPIVAVAQEIDLWSQRDFAVDDAIAARLSTLAATHRDEAGNLASRLVGVQQRLRSFLAELAHATAARQKIEQQIEIARSIQKGLMPRAMPTIQNFNVNGWSRPADRTGGDFFDVLRVSDDAVVLTIADVTGHGIGPALLACAARAYARAMFTGVDDLHLTVSRLNQIMHDDLQDGRFITLVACVLDPARRRIQLLAAGHGPVILYRRASDTLERTLDAHGLPLGVADDLPYDRPMQIDMAPGDVLVLVSDGFFEWANASGVSFGIDRMCDSVLASCRAEPERIVDRLRTDLEAFHGGTDQADDTTALVIRCVS